MLLLFLDDLRLPSQVTHAWHNGTWAPFPNSFDWEIVRSYSEFTEFILKNGKLPDAISFDHDLSFEQYPQGELTLNPIDYSKFKEKTGLDCAKWLTEYCLSHDLDLPSFYVHSFNPVGRMNIVNYLLCFERMRESKKSS